jgi:hypothetical protein
LYINLGMVQLTLEGEKKRETIWFCWSLPISIKLSFYNWHVLHSTTLNLIHKQSQKSIYLSIYIWRHSSCSRVSLLHHSDNIAALRPSVLILFLSCLLACF